MIFNPSLDRLRDRSLHESGPAIDVSGQVMVWLADESTSILWLQRPLAWCAALAAAAAMVAVVLAVIQHGCGAYPLLEMAHSIFWVM